MADPMSWAIAGLVTSVAATATSTTLGIIGNVQQHNQAKANAAAQENQLNYNKRLEEREAARIETETAENVRRQREASEALKAQQRALLGKSGAAMTSGSPLAVLGETAADEELKVQDIGYRGYQSAQEHREQAKMYGYQARVAKAQAPSKTSLGLTIAGNAAEGIGKIGSSIMNFASK